MIDLADRVVGAGVDEEVPLREPMVKFLGLAGQAGAGKDFVKDWLAERSRLDVLRLAYADEVRREVAELFGLECCGPNSIFTKPYSYEVRRLLQWWGTDLRREQDPDYWVKKGIGFALELAVSCPVDSLIVFTDVRFGNEAEAIRKIGGKVLEVVAPNRVRAARTGGMVTPSHASEEIDFEVDGLIENGVDGADPVCTSEIADWLEVDD